MLRCRRPSVAILTQMTDFSSATRTSFLHRLDEETFDILVIGGGITGAGVALDAASRGLKVALIERSDFASGTSSRSSRLIHGGIRYLQHREFSLVYEALAERQRLLRMAPHLVRPLPFVLPIFRGSEFERLATALRAALWAYDMTGGARIGHIHKHIGAEGVASWEPSLDGEQVADAFLYWDACNDDARMTVAVARTAALRFGAVTANYCEAIELMADANGTSAVRCRDALDGGEITVEAKAVVCAAGVWSDEVAGLDRNHSDEARIRPAKGIHIVVKRDRIPGEAATLLPVPDDDRFVFTIPWGDYTIIGTTDTDYEGDFDAPRAEETEINYLLRTVNHWIQDPIDRSEVTASFAGLRPLALGAADEKTADVSRSHVIEKIGSRVVSIYGGKYTTWRLMAEEAVDFTAESVLGSAIPKSATKHLRLDGAVGYSQDRALAPGSVMGSDGVSSERLFTRHGSHVRAVLSICEARGGSERLAPELAYLDAELIYSIRHEMALTLDDLLTRRTRAVTDDANAAVRVAPRASELAGTELGWNTERRHSELEAFRATATTFGAEPTGVDISGGGD